MKLLGVRTGSLWIPWHPSAPSTQWDGVGHWCHRCHRFFWGGNKRGGKVWFIIWSFNVHWKMGVVFWDKESTLTTCIQHFKNDTICSASPYELLPRDCSWWQAWIPRTATGGNSRTKEGTFHMTIISLEPRQRFIDFCWGAWIILTLRSPLTWNDESNSIKQTLYNYTNTTPR